MFVLYFIYGPVPCNACVTNENVSDRCDSSTSEKGLTAE